MLDHKKLGTFSELAHIMKRAIASSLATACLLAKLRNLRVIALQALPVKPWQAPADQKPDHE